MQDKDNNLRISYQIYMLDSHGIKPFFEFR